MDPPAGCGRMSGHPRWLSAPRPGLEHPVAAQDPRMLLPAPPTTAATDPFAQQTDELWLSSPQLPSPAGKLANLRVVQPHLDAFTEWSTDPSQNIHILQIPNAIALLSNRFMLTCSAAISFWRSRKRAAAVKVGDVKSTAFPAFPADPAFASCSW